MPRGHARPGQAKPGRSMLEHSLALTSPKSSAAPRHAGLRVHPPHRHTPAHATNACTALHTRGASSRRPACRGSAP